MWKIDDPETSEIASPKRVRTYHPKHSNTIRFLVYGGSFFPLGGIHIQLFRNQMLAVMVLSQHRVSTSKTVSPRIPVGARCTGHVRIMCSAVCSAAPYSQFDVGARPHLCMND